MMRSIYNIILYLIQPFILIRLLYLSFKNKDYGRRLRERYALNQNNTLPQSCILIHAVSVGEVMAATPLIHALKQQKPTCPIVLTCMTPSASGYIKKKLSQWVHHCYLPYDLPGRINSFLTALKPQIIIIMETEIWPNLVHYAKKNNIPIILGNARLSAKSAAGYMKVRQLIASICNQFNYILTQFQTDSDRFKKLGITSSKIITAGNIKFSQTLTQSKKIAIEELKKKWQIDARPTWIAASTHAGEEEVILKTHKNILKEFPNALLILVPRHPERFASVLKLSQETFTVIRRSQNKPITPEAQIYLGDTVGELSDLYGLSNIAFIGGSFVNTGGHNPIEALIWGKATLSGPYTFNFNHIYQTMVNYKLHTVVNTQLELEAELKNHFNDSLAKNQKLIEKFLLEQPKTVNIHLDYILPLLSE